MSFISPIATGNDGKPRNTGSMQTLGKDDFLQLLVTKLENQDPLKPDGDQEFIAQLAQFASLEQMNNISEGIASTNKFSMLQMQSINNAMASSLIGKDVKAEFSGIYVTKDKEPVISYTMPQSATAVDFVIKDSSGATVATLHQTNVSKGVGSVTWNGTDTRGNHVADGYYKVEATAVSGSQSFKPDLSLTGIVKQILYRDGSAFVNINGVEIALGDITSVGEPGTW